MTIPAVSTMGALRLAAPASLAAMVTHLLGIIDTAVLARGGTTTDIAGVALGTAVFSLLYWSLGFLRMSVSGLVAQAHGGQNETALRIHLLQGVVIGAAVGLILVSVRGPVADIADFAFGTGTQTSPATLAAMASYVEIRLLAAPFAIATYAGIGWLTGQGRTGLMMFVLVGIAGLNAVLDIYFVMHLDMGVRGVALGTAIAETAGALLTALAGMATLKRRGGLNAHWDLSLLTRDWRRIVSLNTDIFLRTLGLSLVFAAFVRAGGQFGDLTLAANQVLMQIVLAAGLILDGPAIAAETLVGRALGLNANRRRAFAEAVQATTRMAIITALVLTAGLFVFQAPLLAAIIPPDAGAIDVLAISQSFYLWAGISPLILVAPFLLDGFYIGATRGRALRNAMAIAVVVFVVASQSLPDLMGNHGLWLSFALFMIARAITLIVFWGGFRDLMPSPARPAAG